MIRVLDKAFPIGCLTMSVALLLLAFYLHTTTNAEALTKDLSTEEQTQKIRVAIIPGHDNDFVGAKFGDITESEMNLKMANYLANDFKADSRFEIYVVRDQNGYADFLGHDKPSSNDDVTTRLYKINHWIAGQKMDLVVNLHFNDYAERKNKDEIGKYEGFSIYVPDYSLQNSSESFKLASRVDSSLNKVLKHSNYYSEKEGIIKSPDLIALGSNNTLSAPSILIEYGYIYEKQFQDENFLKYLVEKTYLGIVQYFN